MTKVYTWAIGFLIMALGGCTSTTIGKIGYSPTGEIVPGREIVLDVEVTSTKPVKYRWNSLDGGRFDSLEARTPKFIVPQVNLVRVECTVLVGEDTPVTRTLTIPVKVAAGSDTAIGGQVDLPPQIEEGRGPVDIVRAGFVPSGWMGDGAAGQKYMKPVLNSPDDLNAHPNCQKWSYRPGEAGWIAIAYQYPADNWGSRPGKNWRGRGFTEIVFYARGVLTAGTMPIVEFKAGGTTEASKKYQDSFSVQKAPIQLTANWQQYSVSLQDQNLASVISGFVFAIAGSANPNGATFYLAEITYR